MRLGQEVQALSRRLARQPSRALSSGSPPVDTLARDYLALALGAGTLVDGLVDAYYGPPELRQEAAARGAAPAQLIADAGALGQRVADEPDGQRRDWLSGQILALETTLRRLAGEEIGYADEVERCFDALPERTPDGVYTETFATLERLLVGSGSLAERVEERGRRLDVPLDRLPGILDWLVGQVRRDCGRHFPVPAGEQLTVSLVSDQPWSGYNWYDGALRSRIEVNIDLPVRAPSLIGLITHECFPGHHLEHAWKEQRLYREQGRGEVSAQMINTPEAYISEGLAEVGASLILDRARWTELFAAIVEQAGLELAPDDIAAQHEISHALNELRAASGDAALMVHAEGRPRAEAIAYLEQRALRTTEQATKALEFIDHPLWRVYVFCYAGGRRLLERWLDAAPDDTTKRARFWRLLTEQLTPSAVAREIPS